MTQKNTSRPQTTSTKTASNDFVFSHDDRYEDLLSEMGLEEEKDEKTPKSSMMLNGAKGMIQTNFAILR